MTGPGKSPSLFPIGHTNMKRSEQPITSTKDVGLQLRAHRKNAHLTQERAAELCGVGTRFFSELERGKPNLQWAKVLQVLRGFGLELWLRPRVVR